VNVSLPHALAVWRRNASMYARTWKLNILPNFFEPVFYLLAVGIGVGAYVQRMGGMSYVEFLAPGLVCVSAMNGASYEVTFNVFVRMNFEKAYDAMLTTPIEPDDVLVGEVMWAITRAAIYGGCFFVIVALFGLAPLPRALLVIPVILLAGLLFAAMGISFSLRLATIDFFSFYFTLFLTPLFLFSGVFFPLEERLTPFWQDVAEVLPLLHPVRLARAAFHGHSSLGLVLWDVGYIVVLSALLLGFARQAAHKRLTT
jgi:lipooligosaccharide transport system permease protein